MMYYEAPNYKKNETWKEISIHDDKNIKGFFGPYRWLSNFEPCKINYEGYTYPSVENAYQAAKLIPEHREYFLHITADQSKKEWKLFTLLDSCSEQWDNRKYNVMHRILEQKFKPESKLAEMLIDTKDKYLSEYNWWQDVYWGYDVNLKEGENNLGKILMEIRENLLCQK